MATDFVIAGDGVEASVSTFGAELTRLVHASHGNLLWHGDGRWWDRRSPTLFPVVGRCAGDRIRVGGKTYPMPLHGFAHSMVFDIVDSAPDRCLLRLSDSPASRMHYPYPFVLDLSYRFHGPALHVEAAVHNPADDPLPASFGFHPGFRWPLASGLPKEDHFLVFEADRRLDVARASDGLILEGGTALLLEDRTLRLSERLFDEGAMVLRSPRSRRVRISAAGSPFSIEVGFDNLSSLGIWMKPGGDFLCIEPWAGHGDPQGFDGDFADKPGMREVAPGATMRFAMQVAALPSL